MTAGGGLVRGARRTTGRGDSPWPRVSGSVAGPAACCGAHERRV